LNLSPCPLLDRSLNSRYDADAAEVEVVKQRMRDKHIVRLISWVYMTQPDGLTGRLHRENEVIECRLTRYRLTNYGTRRKDFAHYSEVFVNDNDNEKRQLTKSNSLLMITMSRDRHLWV